MYLIFRPRNNLAPRDFHPLPSLLWREVGRINPWEQDPMTRRGGRQIKCDASAIYLGRE